MNLFFDYQKKIFNSLKILEKKKVIKIPQNLKSFTVELPPKDQKADMSCNAAMVLAQSNKNSPPLLAEILKKHLLLNFKEFKSIEVAQPGDTVIASIDGQATLKRFYIGSNGIELHPRNKKYNVIHVNEEDELSIQGKLIAVIREY